MTPPRAALRSLAIGRCVTAAGLLLWPDRAVRTFAAGRHAPSAGLVRLLGARLFVQGAMQFTRPDRRIAIEGAAVDSVHAASMIAAAALLPAYRRIAAVSAGEAALSAVAGYAIVRRLR